nr:MAG TPA: hypothetical protein [Bacteriophage sp.]DAP87015.1 MAG TPA: hypothetical protein [Caudoviricetes sp.]
MIFFMLFSPLIKLFSFIFNIIINEFSLNVNT